MEYSFSTSQLSRSSKLKVSQANGGGGGHDGKGLAEIGVEERLRGGCTEVWEVWAAGSGGR